MPEAVRVGARRLLRTRIDRLERLLGLDAPDVLIAAEAALVGKVATMLDPHGTAARRGNDDELAARRAFGVCTECDLPASSGPAGWFCATHAAAFDAELATYETGGPDGAS